MKDNIIVEVAYALPEKQYLQKVVLKKGATVEQAILNSTLLKQFHEIDLRKNQVGIYSKKVKLTEIVENGDRVEIYRPITSDPKILRRKRVKQLVE